jgi:hypothetical protein
MKVKYMYMYKSCHITIEQSFVNFFVFYSIEQSYAIFYFFHRTKFHCFLIVYSVFQKRAPIILGLSTIKICKSSITSSNKIKNSLQLNINQQNMHQENAKYIKIIKKWFTKHRNKIIYNTITSQQHILFNLCHFFNF